MYQEKKALCFSAHFARLRSIWLGLVVLTLTLSAIQPANAATGQLIAHNTPRYVSTAKNLGAEDPGKTMEVTIWLNLHDRPALDAIAQQLYDPTSPIYHHWLKQADLARFNPTPEEAATVKGFFENNNMKVVRTGPNNMFVRARGTVSDVQTAFHVQLNKYSVRGEVIRSNDRDPYVEGAAAPFVRAVAGLDSGKFDHPLITRPTSTPTIKKHAPIGATARPATASPADDFYSSTCFDGLETETFTTAPGGPLPSGTYSGNHYNGPGLSTPGCGYTPAEIQTAYNLNGLYAEGYDGTGQTIGILDACGTPTILNDANAFSAMFGLPALTPSNFTISYIPTPSECSAPENAEINIDVEWAHAIAPGANINLIIAPSSFFSDLDEAEYTAITYGLANVLSGSYGQVESFLPTSLLDTLNLISEIGAVSGISTNFASGDTGDFSVYGIAPTVIAPADSPWATGVGGVSLALNSDNSIAWQAGWGNNITFLTQEGFVEDPVYYGDEGLYAASGGGESNCVTVDSSGNCLAGFAKPSFQKHLAGKYRQVPDVSWLADPFTGAVIAMSVPFDVPEVTWVVYGGTSLATPMFSGLWAIANQEAGAPLGQAAPYLYSLPSGAIFDIVPVGSTTNVTATITDSSGTTKYTAAEVLGGPTPNAPAKFISALWDYPFPAEAYVVSFDTDCAVPSPDFFFDGTPCNAPGYLHTKKGWDNVTGVGTPNAQAFADSFNPAAAAAAK